MSWSSGWYALSRAYPKSTDFEGKTFRFNSMALGRGYWTARYKGLVFVTVAQDGVAISMMFPLQFLLHPPIFIPWSVIKSCERESRVVFNTAFYTTVLTTSNPEKQLSFYREVGDAIYKSYCEWRPAFSDNFTR
jgi:hypothetical protein